MKRFSPQQFWAGIALMAVWCAFCSYIVTDNNTARVITFLVLTVPAFLWSWKRRNAEK